MQSHQKAPHKSHNNGNHNNPQPIGRLAKSQEKVRYTLSRPNNTSYHTPANIQYHYYVRDNQMTPGECDAVQKELDKYH
jgi:hypothetical protein